MAINVISASTFTRPNDTTAYAAGDLVANSTTAGSVTPMEFIIPVGLGKNLTIKGHRIIKSDETDVTNATFRLWLFSSTPTVANGDNGAISPPINNLIGRNTGTAMFAGSDNAIDITAYAEQNWIYHYLGTARSVFGLLEATAAYSPANAETFSVSLIVDQSI